MSGLESATLDVGHAASAPDGMVGEIPERRQQSLAASGVCLGVELRVQGAQLFLISHVANFRQECSRAAGLRRPCCWLA